MNRAEKMIIEGMSPMVAGVHPAYGKIAVGHLEIRRNSASWWACYYWERRGDTTTTLAYGDGNTLCETLKNLKKSVESKPYLRFCGGIADALKEVSALQEKREGGLF